MRVGPGTVVTANVVAEDGDGEVVDDLYRRTPVKFVFADGRFPKGFMEALSGLSAGEEKRFTIGPDKAYGSYDPALVIRVSASELPHPPRSQGELYKLRNEAGEGKIYRVLGFTGDSVRLDGNHPLAGKSLTFSVKVLDVAWAGREREMLP
ncbi:MAG: FKBP-type peptidyl-prolyl cis-trans isomerase [Thermodesulfobacteriota bacterium]